MKNKFLEKEFFLRFAITSACNYRCNYCNPEGIKEDSEALSDNEIMQIIKAGKNAGLDRVHWTGGEPTLKNIEKLLEESRNLGYTDQVLTTNGSGGGEYVIRMKEKGLNRLIVSLDTLNPKKFKEITKSNTLHKVLDTVKTSVKILEEPTKMNIVYMNDTKYEIPELIKLSKEINEQDNKGELIIKFIEMTEMNPVFFSEKGKNLYESSHTGKDIMVKELQKYGILEPVTVIGNNPNTHYFLMPELNIKVGMINIPSQNYNCGGDGCKKIRLNPYGNIAVCVNQQPINIRGRTVEQQTKVMKDLITYRSMLDNFYPDRKHKQEDNFGYWRFGNCGGLNTKI